jgi:mono/diheme cytochrome c family protein
MNPLAKLTVAVLAGIGALAVVALVAFAAGGVSAREAPAGWETGLARSSRHLLLPRAARALENPVPAGADTLASARRHWADHCAICHGNDGKGGTAVGRALSPRAPDMTLPATQRLSDGELFWIIENGVRMTGMPSWAAAEGEHERESWELVHFVRRLPDLTAAELADMRRFNPVSRAQLERELARERAPAAAQPAPADDGHDHVHH